MRAHRLSLCLTLALFTPSAPAQHTGVSSCQHVPESLEARTARVLRVPTADAGASHMSAVEVDDRVATLATAWTFHRAPVVAQVGLRPLTWVVANCDQVRFELSLRRWLRGADASVTVGVDTIPFGRVYARADRPRAPSLSAVLFARYNGCMPSPLREAPEAGAWFAAGESLRANADAIVTDTPAHAAEVASWVAAPRPWSAPVAVDPAVFAPGAAVPVVNERVGALAPVPDVADLVRASRLRWIRFEVVARRNAMSAEGAGVSWVRCRRLPRVHPLGDDTQTLPDAWMFAGAVEEMPPGARLWGAYVEVPNGAAPWRWMFLPGSFVLAREGEDFESLVMSMRGR